MDDTARPATEPAGDRSPSCAEASCPRPATHFYLDAATRRWRHGCARHMRRRRADPDLVVPVASIGRPAGTPPPTDPPEASADA